MTNTEGLPLVYSPEIISAYWGKRPGAVATRAVKLLSVAGGFISHIISDLITDKIKEVVPPIHSCKKPCCYLSSEPVNHLLMDESFLLDRAKWRAQSR